MAPDLKEKTVLSKGQLWLLRVSAFTGVVSLISHGADAAEKVL